MRAPGTTSLIEDVLFPVPRLAEAVTDLQALFATHGYPEGVIFGHAKDGNLHFQINQSFNTQENVRQFDDFTRDLVRVVTGKYDGALKAEHGSGRNMAPFVEAEWGAEAYAIMRDIKLLFDPDGLLNPNVLINPDPQAHITHAKMIMPVSPIVDACIECGFCESKCPSRRLTLSPRQRIIVQREISRLRNSGGSASSELASLMDAYTYDGLDTCAVDGLCATVCPVGINTGELTKQLRAEKVKSEKAAGWVAKNFALVEKSVGWGVRVGHLFEPQRTQRKTKKKLFLASVTKVVETITGATLPKWNNSFPVPTKNLRTLSSPSGDCVLSGEKEYIYFPSCISRQLGTPLRAERSDERSDERSRSASDSGPSTTAISSPPLRDCNLSLAETLITIANRADMILEIPADVVGICCGMPFSSKGYTETYKATLHKTITKFWEWSEGGTTPIVIDTTSCAHSLRTCQESLLPKKTWNATSR